MGDELVDLGHTHFFWMAFVVIKDVLTNPFDVGFFGAGGILLEADEVAVLVQEFLPFWGRCALGFSRVLRLVHVLPPFAGDCIIVLMKDIGYYTAKSLDIPPIWGFIQHAV